MDEKLLKILKDLKQIRPNADYSRQSRLLILASKQEPVMPAKKYGWLGDILAYPNNLKLAAVVAGVLLLVAYGGFYYVNQLNKNNLVVRASELNNSIQIKLDEIQYFINNDGLTTEKISNIQTLLDETVKDLNEASSLTTSQNMEESLQKIKSVQEILNQIDALVK